MRLVRHYWILAFLGSGLVTAAPAVSAGVSPTAAGVQWLQSQVQPDGSLSGEVSSIAVPLQVRSETAIALAATSVAPPSLLGAIGADAGNDTESLARRIVAAASQHQDVSALVQSLTAIQNQDGGFGSQAGDSSDPMDTAWALLALHAANAGAAAPAAFSYLQSQRNPDGSYSLNFQEDLYSSAYVVTALQKFSAQYSLTSLIQPTVSYLQAQRPAGGLWGNSLFLTALCYRAVHDLIPFSPTAADIQTQLDAAQSADGSWDEDPYTTALAVQALTLAAQAPSDPSLSTIQGLLVDGATGLPLDGVTITLTGPTPGTATTTAGRFTLRNLTPGSYNLSMTLAEYGSLSTSTLTRAGQTVDLGALSMVKASSATTGTIRGTVTDAGTGRPVAGASVTSGSAGTATDAAGDYEFADVPPGPVTVQVSADGYQPASAATSLAAGGLVVFSPGLVAGSPSTVGSIQGTITSAATHLPLAGVTVSVSGATTGSASTDANGNYVIADSTNGVVTLRVSLAGYDTVTAQADVFIANGLVFSPPLYAAGTTPPGANAASVTGTVVDSTSNAPLAHVSVIATSPDGTTQNAITAADGSFTVTGLAQAQASLAFSLSGYVSAQFSTPLVPLIATGLGQVRLRPASVGQLLPELTVNSVDGRSQVTTDPQTLALSGTVQAVLGNRGTAEAPAGVQLLAFYDVNCNRVYDAGVDLALGQTVTPAALAPQATQMVAIAVSGVVPFRDPPILVWVDSAQAVVESNENDNYGDSTAQIKLTSLASNIALRQKWAWSGFGDGTNLVNVLGPVIVGHLTDDNGDGRYDQDDVPTLVFGAGTTSDGGGATALVALSGKDGHVVWKRTDLKVTNRGSVAIADIDGDGKSEVIVSNTDRTQLFALKNDGSTLWTAATGPRYSLGSSEYVSDGITVADLNQDGHPEIIQGNHVFDNQGRLLWAGLGDSGGPNNTDSLGNWLGYGYVPVAADIDPASPGMEVLAGRTLYSATGQIIWNRTDIPCDGFDGVGDFGYPNPPQIVLVSCGSVYLLDRNGNTLWKTAVAGGGHGGSPTIADFDGEGRPQIGVAGRLDYAVYGWDGSIRWSKATQDSTAVTGSSAFDFLANGRVEVLYGDEGHFHVYDGATGTVLVNMPNPSTTTLEYPIVADVDGDGQAEIVVASNGNGNGMTTRGIQVYGSAAGNWAPTRSIWNEHAYHVTNVNDDGSVPRVEKNSWQANNTYRLNAFPDHPATALPDLTASYLRVQDFGGSQPSPVTVRVGNGGGVSVAAGVPVAFYDGDPAAGGLRLAVTHTTQALAEGQFQDLSVSLAGSLAGISRLYAVANDDGTGHGTVANDWNIANNTVSLVLSALPGSFSITAVTDQPSYGPGSDVALSAAVANAGSFAGASQVRFSIETQDGAAEVSGVPLPDPVMVAAGASQIVTALWNTGTTLAGPYRLKAELLDAAGMPYAAAYAPFSIVADGAPGLVTTGVATDKATYAPTDTVLIHDRLANGASNAIADDITFTTTVTNPDGSVRWSNTGTLAELVPGGLQDVTLPLALANAPAGSYGVTLTASMNGTELPLASASFAVQSSAATAAGVTGTISATPAQVPVSGVVTLDANLTDNGNAALSGVTATLAVLDPVSGQLVFQAPVSLASVAQGQSVPLTAAWTTAGVAGQTYVAILMAEVGGVTKTLAQANFKLLDPTVGLMGTLTATPGQVPLGTSLALTGSVTNGGQGLSVIGATLAIQDPNGATVFSALTGIGALSSGQTSQAFATWLASGPVGQAYTATLTAVVGGYSKLLAQTNFMVVAPPIKLSAALAEGSRGRVLILADDASNGSDPFGPSGSLGVAAQNQHLEAVLKAAGWSYTLVTSADDFETQFDTGGYEVYMILSESVKLSVSLQDRIVDAVDAGAGLLVAGNHDSRNSKLDDALGVHSTGKSLSALGLSLVASALEPAGGQVNFAVDGQPLSVNKASAEVLGNFSLAKGATSPAVFGNAYGSGKALYFAFDLELEAASATPDSMFDTLLGDSLAYVHPSTLIPFVGRVIPLVLSIQNQGIATPAVASLVLPAGVTVVDANGASVSGNIVQWSLDLGAGQTITETVWVKLPPNPGSVTLSAEIYSGTPPALTPQASANLIIGIQAKP